MKINSTKSNMMKTLVAEDYSYSDIAKAFNVTPYTVKYQTDDRFKSRKQLYSRAYYAGKRAR